MKKNNKGFTLAELLIVVAIIAVLAAIAIPVFTTQLEKAKEATDMANIRSAYAEVSANLLTSPEDDINPINVDAAQGQENWQTNGGSATTKIGGQDVLASTVGWTVSVDDGAVVIAVKNS